jgi:hypothetical protein
VTDSTVFMWFIADVCVSLYSSTLFEARSFGADVFTPVLASDAVYRPELLALLSHPDEENTLGGRLADFILSREKPPLELIRRAEARLLLVAA